MPRNQISTQNDNNVLERKPIGWFPISEISKGDVSTVFKVTDSNGKIEAAMKVEKVCNSNVSKNMEKDVLWALRNDPNSVHLLDYFHAGQYRCTVMTMAGPDLQFIRSLMNKKFSDSTILRLAIRTLLAIKVLHEHCFVHRDLEPANIALSFDTNSRNVFLLDFGVARQYAKQENGKWFIRTPREKAPFRGSVQYCSPKTHDFEEVGRVDDLWSWLYIFVEMRVYLPWTDSTHQMKYGPRKRTLLEETLESDPFLSTFLPIAKLMKSWKYADRPDYLRIYEILAAKMELMGVKWSDPMDYDLQMEQRYHFSKPTTNEDQIVKEQLSSAFRTVVVPGGTKYVLPSNVDFLSDDTKKNKERKKDDKDKTCDVTSKCLEVPSKPTQKMSKMTKVSSCIATPKNVKTSSTTSSATSIAENPAVHRTVRRKFQTVAKTRNKA